jgi:hypothetical protein
LPTIVFGFTIRSKSAADTPDDSAAWRSVVDSSLALWAMADALS